MEYTNDYYLHNRIEFNLIAFKFQSIYMHCTHNKIEWNLRAYVLICVTAVSK